VPHCDTEVFQLFLDTLTQEVPPAPDKRVVLILDNAGWHKTKSLRWQHLKGHYIAGYITKHGHELNQKLFDSIRALLDRPQNLLANHPDDRPDDLYNLGWRLGVKPAFSERLGGSLRRGGEARLAGARSPIGWLTHLGSRIHLIGCIPKANS